MSMMFMMMKTLVVICILLGAARGENTDGTTPAQQVVSLRQSHPSCPHTEFKCQADESKRFDTYLLVQFAEEGDNSKIMMVSSAMVEQAYDFVAGTVCDLCRRRVVRVQQIPKKDQSHFLEKLEEVKLVSSHPLLRTRNLALASDNNKGNHHLFQVTIEQVGNCPTAFDTNEPAGGESTVQHFIHACQGKFFDKSSEICCCSCAADFNAMSRQAFLHALSERMEQEKEKSTSNKDNKVQVLDVLELHSVVVAESS